MDWNVEAPEDHGLDAGRLAGAAKAVGEIERLWFSGHQKRRCRP